MRKIIKEIRGFIQYVGWLFQDVDSFAYDEKTLQFGPRKKRAGEIVLMVVRYVLLSFAVASVCYLLIALVHDSDEESRLSDENSYIEEHYGELRHRAELIDNVIEGLQEKDKQIYLDVFNTIPPSYRLDEADSNRLDISNIDSYSEEDIIWYAYARASRLESYASRISEGVGLTARSINRRGEGVTSIPSIVPIRNFNVSSTGASVGRKLNPFFKTIRDHNGIDLIAPVGEKVVSTADGVVRAVYRGQKVFGNRVEISHSEGIVTTYSNLEDMVVKVGQTVRQGDLVGHLGSSGMSFAPHLHYEVIKDGVPMEPVYYFFADLTPAQFREMLITALTTGQSME